MKKIKDIGEFNLIKRITKKPRSKDIVVGIGDDAAVIRTNKGLQVLSTDTVVEDIHFTKKWFSPEQIGKKAVESNISDIFAMSAKPRFLLVSLVLPKNLNVTFVDKLYQSIHKTAKKYKAEVIGGNMAKGKEISITITAIGEAKKQSLHLRSMAKPGDFIMVSKHLGERKAGLEALQKKCIGFIKIKKAYLEPEADFAAVKKNAPFVHAMIDISDGLAADIHHICKASNCGAVLFKDKLPMSKETRAFARKQRKDPAAYALESGEEYALLYTVPEKNLTKVSGFLIGEITKKKGVRLYTKGKEYPLKVRGYEHFKV